jgi:hypothetical protein
MPDDATDRFAILRDRMMVGIGSGKHPAVYPETLVAEVSQLYHSGLTQAEIGTKIGMSQKVIWRIMQNHGIKARVAAKRDQRGEKNHLWKGRDASYSAFHFRVERERGTPQSCDVCGTARPDAVYEWANLTGKYDDTQDYKRMCRSCHHQYDNARRKGVMPYA